MPSRAFTRGICWNQSYYCRRLMSHICASALCSPRSADVWRSVPARLGGGQTGARLFKRVKRCRSLIPRSTKPERNQKVQERTIFVTGSLIPQRVQLRPIGTATASPVRIIDRREIDGTGRFTTPGAFVDEPSLRVSGALIADR